MVSKSTSTPGLGYLLLSKSKAKPPKLSVQLQKSSVLTLIPLFLTLSMKYIISTTTLPVTTSTIISPSSNSPLPPPLYSSTMSAKLLSPPQPYVQKNHAALSLSITAKLSSSIKPTISGVSLKATLNLAKPKPKLPSAKSKKKLTSTSTSMNLPAKLSIMSLKTHRSTKKLSFLPPNSKTPLNLSLNKIQKSPKPAGSPSPRSNPYSTVPPGNLLGKKFIPNSPNSLGFFYDFSMLQHYKSAANHIKLQIFIITSYHHRRLIRQ